MSFSDAAKMMHRAGIKPSVDLQLSALPAVRTRQQLDALRDQGLAEMDRYGQSLAYQQWMGLLARGADSSLIDLEVAGGGIPRTAGDQLQELYTAQANSERYLSREFLSGNLRTATLDGRHISEWPVDAALTRLAELLADAAPGPARNELVNFYSELEGAPASSFTGIEYSQMEPINEYRINSDPDVDRHSDPYTAYRESLGMNPQYGLEGMKIQPQAYPDPMLSGVIARPGGGLEYSVADDYVYQQSVAQQSNDFHQGDATNTFSD